MRDLCFITNDGYSMYCSEITGIKAVEEDNFEVTAKVFCGVYGEEIIEKTFVIDEGSLIVGIHILMDRPQTPTPTPKNTPENIELLGEEEEI